MISIPTNDASGHRSWALFKGAGFLLQADSRLLAHARQPAALCQDLQPAPSDPVGTTALWTMDQYHRLPEETTRFQRRSPILPSSDLNAHHGMVAKPYNTKMQPDLARALAVQKIDWRSRCRELQARI